MSSMRFWATGACQRRMAACSNLVWPLGTFRVPASRYGLRVSMAPVQKKLALLSSGLPAKSSTLNGPLPSTFLPLASTRPRPVSNEVACWTPTV
ncbi:hypothetical protein SRABI128_05125 [Microbacterium sp. Bi128]|nr:hypothetical protein SRABI128_05125 [Microbacterium sp. Bi128]